MDTGRVPLSAELSTDSEILELRSSPPKAHDPVLAEGVPHTLIYGTGLAVVPQLRCQLRVQAEAMSHNTEKLSLEIVPRNQTSPKP